MVSRKSLLDQINEIDHQLQYLSYPEDADVKWTLSEKTTDNDYSGQDAVAERSVPSWPCRKKAFRSAANGDGRVST
jgi:hypothetical protein